MLTVFSKNNCPECVKAMAFLDANEIPYESVKVDERREAYEFLISRGHKSVPQVYLDDVLFVEGGFKGLQAMGAAKINHIVRASK